MEDIPLSAELAVLGVVLGLSAFFFIAQNTKMGLEHHLLKHPVPPGHGGGRPAGGGSHRRSSLGDRRSPNGAAALRRCTDKGAVEHQCAAARYSVY